MVGGPIDGATTAQVTEEEEPARVLVVCAIFTMPKGLQKGPFCFAEISDFRIASPPTSIHLACCASRAVRDLLDWPLLI